jgi:pimeloyl-ACP methyl ester carboxylesterase
MSLSIGLALGLAFVAGAPNADSGRRRIVDSTVQRGLRQLVRERRGASRIWVGPLRGNEGRDVLIYVPPGYGPAADLQIVVHFHGTYSEHIEKQRDGLGKKKWVGWKRLTQTLDGADELQRRQQGNVAIVYPFSAGKRAPQGYHGWWNLAFDIRWMEQSFDGLVEQAREVLVDELGVEATRIRPEIIAEGHSAGGVALTNIAYGNPGSVDELIFLDASFQSWADGAFRALERAGSDCKITIVQTERGIADPHRGRTPWCADELLSEADRWWCDALADDMRDVDRVFLHRTRVPHGKQPRRFVGGLGLPPDRH